MAKAKNTLFISDTQFPFEHKDYLRFCKAVVKKFNIKDIIHVGDIFDALNFSDYERHPDAPSIPDELTATRKAFKQWEKAFPKVRCVVGNHDYRVRRKLDRAGFSEKYLSLDKIYRDVLHFPKGWSLHDKVELKLPTYGRVLVLHGDERGARVTPGSTMRIKGCSVVRGHHHSKAFVFFEGYDDCMRFDMIVGSGIDKKAVAFNYNKKDIVKPILACGIIVDGVPQVVPMLLKSNGRWVGKV